MEKAADEEENGENNGADHGGKECADFLFVQCCHECGPKLGSPEQPMAFCQGLVRK